MRVTHRSDDELVLSGVPGGRVWMVVLVVFGLAATAAAVYFLFAVSIEAGGWTAALLPLAFGVVLAQVFFWTGAVTLAVGRLALRLDRASGRGAYEVRSPIVEAGKPTEFELRHAHSVSLERTTEWRPGRNGGGDSRATVWRARLRLNKPRSAIVLDETENNRLDRVEGVATEVAEFLGVPLERDG